QETSNRISNIQAKDYTRMGFAVRYATRCLLKSEAKHRILLMLSDGKPDDYDGYQGEYGIQDTRKAILEAQGQAINPYSITIDKQAQAYLPRLFGPGQYMILNNVSTLPLKLSEVYKKLSN
ncbi:MAG: VWA domain-containing protein, partial [Proteobacteria bacterium]|nr:VWA domain-containing protein [Pseudomonadota bacterium]